MSETIEIRTRKDLETFRNRVNGGEYNLDAELLDDIDISSYSIGGQRFPWLPIGENHDGFSGTFNGNGHIIWGLYVDYINTSHRFGAGAGLFGFNRGFIKNLTVEGVVRSRSCVGGICGHNSTLLENCINECEVESESFAGGICGLNEEGGEVKNCINFGNVKKAHHIGGVVGASNNNKIISCRNEGKLFLNYWNLYDYDAFKANNYEVNQIGVIDNMSTSNRQKGKVVMPFQNTITGLYLLHNSLLHVNVVKDLLKHDKSPTHTNIDGETYLHLLCRNENKTLRPQAFIELLETLATETDIDFASVNKDGKEAADFLRDPIKNRTYKGCASFIKFIKEVKKDQHRLEQEDNTFSDIGW